MNRQALSVCLVDDDAVTLEMLRALLEEQGVTVLASWESLAQARAGNLDGADAVFLDVNLPDGEGFELAQEIKSVLPGMRVIMVSGTPSVEVLRKVAQYQCDGFMLKPFLPAKLSDLLRTWR